MQSQEAAVPTSSMYPVRHNTMTGFPFKTFELVVRRDVKRATQRSTPFCAWQVSFHIKVLRNHEVFAQWEQQGIGHERASAAAQFRGCDEHVLTCTVQVGYQASSVEPPLAKSVKKVHWN